MIFGFLRKNPRRATVETLYERIAAASRHPQLYLALGVPDTLEGRFESLMLHTVLTLRRLRRLPPPAEDVAQDLVDALFHQLDRSLREMGVGDFGVPKRMTKLAQAYYGRAARYGPLLDAAVETALAEALGGYVHDGARPARALARYALAAETELAALDLDALLQHGPGFPVPDRFSEGDLP